ncbi:hypothetical protein BCV70DRAFT_196859, partial [Testicularia cyperi]
MPWHPLIRSVPPVLLVAGVLVLRSWLAMILCRQKTKDRVGTWPRSDSADMLGGDV